MCQSSQAFLGVKKSITGRFWQAPSVAQCRWAEMLSQAGGWPDLMCQYLAWCKIEPADVEHFLNPQIRTLLPDPRQLKDLEKAAKRLTVAYQNRQRVAIFADYDVDGAASAALLHDWFGKNDIKPTIYVPDRIKEGYGPNETAMSSLASTHDLIVCVDCGTAHHTAIAAADNTDVIILDHHLGSETLPPAYATVNPNRMDEDQSFGHLSAAGVVFLTLVEANRILRKTEKNLPNLMHSLDLVALATIADVVPLLGVNRAFVRQGIKIAVEGRRVGLQALIATAQIKAPLSPYHLGYVLGPRLNAGGRIGQADLAAQLLTASDQDVSDALAEKLEDLNYKRRALAEEVSDAAIAQAEARGFDRSLVWAAGEGWHAGVIGIAAARLKEVSNRPAIVIGLSGDCGKGSGRSIGGIDLGAAVQNLCGEDKIITGGGHAMAAGLSLTRQQLDGAMKRLETLLDRQAFNISSEAVLRIDGALMPAAADIELIEHLNSLGPFGAAASAPRVVFPDQTIFSVKTVGENHLKICFGTGRSRFDGIAFNAFASPLGTSITQHNQRHMHLAGRLDLNHWQGQITPQLKLEDAAVAHG